MRGKRKFRLFARAIRIEAEKLFGIDQAILDKDVSIPARMPPHARVSARATRAERVYVSVCASTSYSARNGAWRARQRALDHQHVTERLKLSLIDEACAQPHAWPHATSCMGRTARGWLKGGGPKDPSAPDASASNSTKMSITSATSCLLHSCGTAALGRCFQIVLLRPHALNMLAP